MIAPPRPSRAWTVSDLLVWTEAHFRKLGFAAPRLDAELLLAHALGCRRIELYTGYHQVVQPDERERFRALVERRGQGEPVAYLTGAREFHSLSFEVNRAVLIPRPETEHLVDAVAEHFAGLRPAPAGGEAGNAADSTPPAADSAPAAEGSVLSPPGPPEGAGMLSPSEGAGVLAPPSDFRPPTSDFQLPTLPALPPLRLLDLGTGSGNIAVAVLHRLSGVEAVAVDLSREALEVARGNARRHGVEERVQFLEGDLFAALPEATPPFQAIVSNPPYITPREHPSLSKEVRDFEPRLALVDDRGGPEGAGIGYHREIVRGAARFLSPGGLLALEVGAGQAGSVAELLLSAGFLRVETITDYGGIARVVKGTRP